MTRLKDGLVVVATAAMVTALVLPISGQWLSGLSLDYLFFLRALYQQERHAPDSSHVVIVAVDEETYQREPFARNPRVMWTPYLAEVQGAVVAGGAKVLGYDMIFPTSVMGLKKHYDDDFHRALDRDGKQAGRVVLAKGQHQQRPLAPFVFQNYAVGGAKNIRSVNLKNDPDDVVRRAPLVFRARNVDGGVREEPSMALELVSRALSQRPSWDDDLVRIGGWTIPGSEERDMIVNFDYGHDIPTYSFADLYACAQAGNSEFFSQHFQDKVVLLGTMLDVEDRKLTSKRLITAGEQAAGEQRCVHEPMTEIYKSDLVRDVIPGVLVHATVVNNILRRDYLVTAPPLLTYATAFMILLLISAASVKLRPLWAGGAALLIGLSWTLGATLVFASGMVLPLLQVLVAGLLAYIIMLGYRFTSVDHDRNYLKSVFGLYLAPELIDEIVSVEKLPALAGERLRLTFLFTDVADFTRMSEEADPEAVGKVLNDYLDGVIAIVHQHKGTLIQLMGDAVFAFFGAPVVDSQHADHATACAVAIDKFAEAYTQREEPKALGFGLTRIGVHTGYANVGNFGGNNRFSYTAIGDAVNTAARIEGANKYFGTRFAISEDTRSMLTELETTLIARVVLKGRSEPLALYRPLSQFDSEDTYLMEYNKAIRLLDVGDKAAIEAFRQLIHDYPTRTLARFHWERIERGELSTLVVLDSK